MPGLLRGIARTAVVAGTATAVSNRVSRRQANRWQSQGQEYDEYPQEAPPPQAAAPDPGVDRVAQLRDLGKLHTDGILTDEEFEAKKKQILGI